MGNKNFSNDATKKILGTEYQKLIALEHCLNAQKNEYVWLECKGDVADLITSNEVKHHIGKNYISSNSIDVWKTVNNYVKEFEVTNLFSQLVLHTTSIVQEASIFHSWNNLQPEQKLELLVSHSPVDSITSYYNQIIEFPVDNLKEILGKFSILDSQPNIFDKWEQLKNHATFKLIPERFKEAALEQLCGYMTRMAINNCDEWQININDFNSDIQTSLSRFVNGNTPFPEISIESLLRGESKKYNFIKKMKSVKLNEKAQNYAVIDYMRANLSQIKMLQMTPTLDLNLNSYDKNIERMLEDQKSLKATDLKSEQLDTDESHNLSKKLYFECITLPPAAITGVDNTQKYYRDGRIHYSLEKTGFEWKFSQDDI